MLSKRAFTLMELILVFVIMSVIVCALYSVYPDNDFFATASYYSRYIIVVGGIFLAIIGFFALFSEPIGGLFLLIIGFGIWFGVGFPKEKPLTKQEKLELQQQKAQQKKSSEEINFKRELNTFAQNKIPDLYSAINETHRMREEIKNKKSKLTKVLQQLGRVYSKDEDIKRYDDLLEKLNVADKEYDNMLKEGYLQYKKFEISSDPAYEKMLENYNNKAKHSLEENVDSFNKMRNQLSEKRNKE